MAETRNLPKEWWDSFWSEDNVEKVEERPKGFTDISNKVKEFIELPDEQRITKIYNILSSSKGKTITTNSRVPNKETASVIRLKTFNSLVKNIH